MSIVVSLSCDNPQCLNKAIGECEIDPYHPCEVDASTLRHDAQLSGWIRYGTADYCCEECRKATVGHLISEVHR